MDFYEVLEQVIDLLRHRGRVAYRTLKMQFKLDDEGIEALKDELIDAQRLAVDEGHPPGGPCDCQRHLLTRSYP